MFVQRLILLLCLSSLVKTGISLMNVVHTSTTKCIVQGFLNQYFSWVELLWVCAIALNIAMLVHGANLERFEGKVHLIVWIFSVFWTIIPLLGKYYGPAGNWCWIQRQYTAVRFGVWYIPLILIILLMMAGYVHLLCYSFSDAYDRIGNTNFEMEQTRSQRQKEVAPLLFYPVIYFILNLPLLIYRIEDASNPGDLPNYILLLISVISSPLTGAFNAIAFAILEDTLKESCTIAAVVASLRVCFCGDNTRIVHDYQVVNT